MVKESQPSVVRVLYTWAFERSFSAELYLAIVFSPDAGALTEAGRCIPKKLLDQINMSHDHSATAVSPTTQLIHGISKKSSANFYAHLFSPSHTRPVHHRREAEGTAPISRQQPSIISRCSSNLRRPHTFPQEKQRTGMIMAAESEG